ncbi:MAG: hypothetical protein HFJ35_03515 [Clostridia bacterium]|nr:hypothetical protein [Clostridia bacterium]
MKHLINFVKRHFFAFHSISLTFSLLLGTFLLPFVEYMSDDVPVNLILLIPSIFIAGMSTFVSSTIIEPIIDENEELKDIKEIAEYIIAENKELKKTLNQLKVKNAKTTQKLGSAYESEIERWRREVASTLKKEQYEDDEAYRDEFASQMGDKFVEYLLKKANH